MGSKSLPAIGLVKVLLTFEPKAVAEKEQQVQNLVNYAIAQGLPPEQAKQMSTIFRAKAMDPQEVAIEIRKALKQNQPSGMLNSEQVAAKEFAKIITMAISYLYVQPVMMGTL